MPGGPPDFLRPTRTRRDGLPHKSQAPPPRTYQQRTYRHRSAAQHHATNSTHGTGAGQKSSQQPATTFNPDLFLLGVSPGPSGATVTNSVYKTAVWQRLSRRCLARDGHRCQIRLPGCLGVATQSDHIVELQDGGAPYDLANLQAACSFCNTSKSRRRKRPGTNRQSW